MKVTLLSGSGEMELSRDVLDRPIAPTIQRVDLPNGDVLLIRMVAEIKPEETDLSEAHKMMICPPKPATEQTISVFSPCMGRAESADMIGVSSVLGCQTYHDHGIAMLLSDPRIPKHVRNKIARSM